MSKQIEIINGRLERNPRLRYVLDFLENHPSAPLNVSFVNSKHKTGNADIDICYGNSEAVDYEFYVPASDVFFNLEDLSYTPNICAEQYDWNEKKLYSVELKMDSEIESKPFLQEKTFSFDLFETIFYHISRYEEWFSTESKDSYGRMQSRDMFLVRFGLHHSPVVDVLVKSFYEALGFEVKTQNSQIRLTHDIDVLEKYPSLTKVFRALARKAILEKSPLGMFSLIKQYVEKLFRIKKDPYDTFEWLLSDNQKIERIMFVLSGGEIKNQEAFFDVDATLSKKMIALAKSRGYEIALHPSLNTTAKLSLMKQEKMELEEVVGAPLNRARQHFLKFSWPQTILNLEQIGIEIDESIGFTDRFGFRCGTGFPYHLYNFNQEQAFQILTIPLIVMDVGWIRETASNFPLEKLGKEVQKHSEEKLLDFMAKNQLDTCITFNFHNSFFDDLLMDAQRMKPFYLALFSANPQYD